MDKIKVKWCTNVGGISQIYSNGLEFTFCSRDGRQCAPFVFCKDFLHDCIYASLYNKTASIYGFTYDPKTCPPIDMERTKILATNSSDKNFGVKVENCVDFMHKVEKHLKLKLSKIYECEDPPKKYAKCGIYLFESSGMWQTAPPLLSLYALFTRIGFVHNKEDSAETTIEKLKSGKTAPYQTNDASYLKQAENGIDLIMKLGYRKIFYIDPKKNYPENINMSTLHNNFGIVAFAGESTKGSVPYWHRKRLIKLKKAIDEAEKFEYVKENIMSI